MFVYFLSVYLYDVFDIVCCSTCSFLFAYFAWARAIIYSIIYMEAFKKNDIFLFILLFREVGARIACIYDVFGVKDVSPVKSLLCSMMCLA